MAGGVSALRIEAAFSTLFPEALIGVVTARGVVNDHPCPECSDLLEEQIAETAARLQGWDIGSHPAVAPWRAAYAAFGVKPSKTRSGLENLMRSALSGRLRSINPLVDLYNVVSLRHLLPCGGEDRATIAGDLRLTRAVGDEHFVPLGRVEPEPPPPGAVIYRDDLGVVCSCWNWREADRTKLTPATRDAVLVVESIPPLLPDALDATLRELADLVAQRLDAEVAVSIASAASPEVALAG